MREKFYRVTRATASDYSYRIATKTTVLSENKAGFEMNAAKRRKIQPQTKEYIQQTLVS